MIRWVDIALTIDEIVSKEEKKVETEVEMEVGVQASFLPHITKLEFIKLRPTFTQALIL